MRLLRIEISGFRQIRDARIEWRPINVLFGPNDGGKSSLLMAIESILAQVGGAIHTDGARGAITAELAPLEDDIDIQIWDQLQNRGATWVHSSRRLVDEQDADWFNTRMFSPSDLVEQLQLVEIESIDQADVSAELVGELERSCPDPEALEAASTVFGTALASRVFRVDTQNGWQWAADPAGVPASVWAAVEILRRRMPSLEREADPRRSGTTGWDESSKAALWDLKGAMWALEGGGEYLYPCSWDLKPQAAVLGLWRVVRIGDPDSGRSQAEMELASAIDWFATRLRADSESDPWLEEGDDGWVRVREPLLKLVTEAERVANDLAPEFVTRDYDIHIGLTLPSRWRAPDLSSRVEVLLRLHGADDAGQRLTEVGSGLGVWTSYVILEAVRRLRDDFESQLAQKRGEPSAEDLFLSRFGDQYSHFRPDSQRFDGSLTYREWFDRAKAFPLIPPSALYTVYIFDEPERHLHPVAQIEARDWIASLVQDPTCSVVVATHSLEFLDIPSTTTQYLRVARSIDRTPTLTVITDDVLGALRKEAGVLGIRPTQLIHLTRLWLLVEGEHDAMVIRHFFGPELQRHRVALFPLRGAKNALSIGQLEHLASYQAPIDAIFDTAIADHLHNSRTGREPTSLEQRVISALGRLADENEVDLKIHELGQPDIICVLPTEAVQRTIDSAALRQPTRFPGWPSLLTDHAATVESSRTTGNPPPSLKQFVLRRLGLKMDADAFVANVLRNAVPPLATDSPLATIMEEVFIRASCTGVAQMPPPNASQPPG